MQVMIICESRPLPVSSSGPPIREPPPDRDAMKWNGIPFHKGSLSETGEERGRRIMERWRNLDKKSRGRRGWGVFGFAARYNRINVPSNAQPVINHRQIRHCPFFCSQGVLPQAVCSGFHKLCCGVLGLALRRWSWTFLGRGKDDRSVQRREEQKHGIVGRPLVGVSSQGTIM